MDKQDRLFIGLTGNIASGKSTVMRLAAERGAYTIDADQVVHDLLNEDTAVQQQIAGAFGEQMLQADGRVDRAAVGRVVFNDPEALARLEQIVHPHVAQRIATLIQDSDAPVVMIEAIKLLEGQLWQLCHEVWVTTCSYERQMERLQICRGMSAAEAQARIKAQSPAAEKIARADVVINTDGLMGDTRQQFDAAWTRLQVRQ